MAKAPKKKGPRSKAAEVYTHPDRTLPMRPEVGTQAQSPGVRDAVAFVFGPENGAISEKLVQEALNEASLKRYKHLYVIGFAIQPHARQLVDRAADMGLLPATYVQATPDLMMGDLLKNMRSSQIFSVCGLPEVKVHREVPAASGAPPRFSIELIGLDTFDPTTMEIDHRGGGDVPCWMLDADYNNLCFRATQVFFPRTGAWESLKKALKADYEETVWDHLAGTRERTVRSRGASAGRGEGHRRSRQRAAGREGARVRWVSTS